MSQSQAAISAEQKETAMPYCAQLLPKGHGEGRAMGK